MSEKISPHIRQTEERVRKLCEGCADIVIRSMFLGKENRVECLVVYIEAAVSNMMLEDSVIGKFLNHLWEMGADSILETAEENGLGISDMKELASMEEAMAAMLAGNAVLFLDGYDRGLKIGSKGYPGMGVSKADSEKVLRGSREAFSESVKINTALVRKRLRTTALKVEEHFLGEESNTLLSLVYMENLAYPSLLEEIRQRLGQICIDGIMDSGMV